MADLIIGYELMNINPVSKPSSKGRVRLKMLHGDNVHCNNINAKKQCFRIFHEKICFTSGKVY